MLSNYTSVCWLLTAQTICRTFFLIFKLPQNYVYQGSKTKVMIIFTHIQRGKPHVTTQ